MRLVSIVTTTSHAPVVQNLLTSFGFLSRLPVRELSYIRSSGRHRVWCSTADARMSGLALLMHLAATALRPRGLRTLTATTKRAGNLAGRRYAFLELRSTASPAGSGKRAIENHEKMTRRRCQAHVAGSSALDTSGWPTPATGDGTSLVGLRRFHLLHPGHPITRPGSSSVWLHEPYHFAPLPAQHGAAAPPLRGARPHRPRRHPAGRAGAVHHPDLASGRVPHPVSLRHGVSPNHGRHAERVPRAAPPRGPVGSRGRSRWDAVTG